ncbi:unnamed protein product, partial [Mesorhabditis spiculigera]
MRCQPTKLQDAFDARNRTVSRLQPFASTIFAEMTALATLHDAVNLVIRLRSSGPSAPPGDQCCNSRTGRTRREVVLIEPYYDSYAASVALAGAVRRTVPLVAAGRRILGRSRCIARRDHRQDEMLIVNSPPNPTGTVFTDHELSDRRTRVRTRPDRVGDEVYEHLVFDGLTHTPMASLPGMRERTVTVSVRRTFNVTGWKTGWAIGPRELIDEVRAAKQFMSFCCRCTIPTGRCLRADQRTAVGRRTSTELAGPNGTYSEKL